MPEILVGWDVILNQQKVDFGFVKVAKIVTKIYLIYLVVPINIVGDFFISPESG